MASDDGGRPEREHTASKVGRLIVEYDLNGMGAELADAWLGVDGDRTSLRDLAEQFNERLVAAALAEADVDVLEGEAENTYRLLTDDDVSSGVRTRTRRSLEREGVDVERLRRDFVSHQAVHTYLTEFRGVERAEETDADRAEKAVGTVQRLESRVAAVTEKTARGLRDADNFTLGSFDVLIDVRVFCEDCGTQYDAVELFQGGGCDCEAG